MKYDITIHYEGFIRYVIEADSKKNAEAKAVQIYNARDCSVGPLAISDYEEISNIAAKKLDVETK